MVITFYDREAELKALEDIFSRRSFKSNLIVIYGRRRIGKTELAKKFLEGKKSVWLFVEPKSDHLILEDLEKEAEKIAGIKPKFESWDEFFRFAFSQKDVVIAFDEFQNFSKTSPHLFSKMQRHWDENCKKSGMMMIVIGSYVGMMKKLFYDQKEPLFGRADLMLNMKPFSFRQTCGFLKQLGIESGKEEAMKTYFIFGGVPKYLLCLAQFNIKTAEEAIKNLFIRQPRTLAEEGKNILVMEFGSEHKGYFSILEAISLGKVIPKEIADYTGLEKNTVAKYLHELCNEYEIIRKENPLNEKKRSARYFIKDNFFSFWFRFIHRNMSMIELNPDEAFTTINSELNSFFGRVFEDAAKESLPAQKMPFTIQKTGRWWRKEKEIDLIALNEKTKDIAFFEVKWQSLSRSRAEKILEDLKDKSSFMDWNSSTRKEWFGIIAKELEEKAELRKKGYLAFDLKDF